MSRSALQRNIDGTESLELLSSFKKMYEEKRKANKVEKKYLRDILLDGIVVEIKIAQNHTKPMMRFAKMETLSTTISFSTFVDPW